MRLSKGVSLTPTPTQPSEAPRLAKNARTAKAGAFDGSSKTMQVALYAGRSRSAATKILSSLYTLRMSFPRITLLAISCDRAGKSRVQDVMKPQLAGFKQPASDANMNHERAEGVMCLDEVQGAWKVSVAWPSIPLGRSDPEEADRPKLLAAVKEQFFAVHSIEELDKTMKEDTPLLNYSGSVAQLSSPTVFDLTISNLPIPLGRGTWQDDERRRHRTFKFRSVAELSSPTVFHLRWRTNLSAPLRCNGQYFSTCGQNINLLNYLVRNYVFDLDVREPTALDHSYYRSTAGPQRLFRAPAPLFLHRNQGFILNSQSGSKSIIKWVQYTDDMDVPPFPLTKKWSFRCAGNGSAASI
ncbi:hypothetical protein B0H16DRAFT_251457 [Mycena metata]|uniref:Uncharacterized protein n=1 Tax=Mycena metata TaxID=1033252 RepID=A0AAD7MQL1_9AGAR|nr:hypothetical protein B0H16DRAFT_251457 [Mycena metata]